MLNVVDDVTRESLAAIPYTSILGARVTRELPGLMGQRGRPGMIVSDNGTEFISNAMLAWAGAAAIDWHFIQPGRPMRSGFVKSFNGRMRDELSYKALFFGHDHVRLELAAWVTDYNTQRPHSALIYQTPAAFAAMLASSPRSAAAVENIFAACPVVAKPPQGYRALEL